MSRRQRTSRSGRLYRSVGCTAALLAITVGWGLAIRFAPLGLPHPVVKYGGSAFWAASIYWLVSSAASSRRLVQAVLIAGGVATAVELFKLHHTPWLDGFRHTLLGVLFLGHHFSIADLLAYWCAILAAFLLDRLALRTTA